MPSFKPTPPVSIQVVCNGETKHFTTYWQAHCYFGRLANEQYATERKDRAEMVFRQGVKYIYEAKMVLETKFDFWVAKSKDHKYNIRVDGEPFVFGKKKMFGLTGRELLDFYNRYVKVVSLAQ